MRSLAQPPVPVPAPQGALAQFAAPLPALCHVTIVGPRKKADLALPADIPLPHVLPGLLRAMGEIGGEAATAPGWVLQRPGGPPLDIAQSLGALGVLDGEVLYLRPREAAAPPAMFDDVADVVATGVKESAGNWTSSHTRLVGVGSAMAVLAAGAVTLVFAGPPWTASAVVAGVIALLLVVAGALVSRVVGDSFAGALVGHAALPYGFIAGLLAPAGNGGLTGLGAAHLLAAFATVGLVATIAVIAIADGVQGFLGTAIAAMAGAVSSGVVMVSGASPAGVAAVTLTVLLAFSSLIPTVSFRAAGMPMPSMPTNAEELRGDNQRVDGPSVRERTLRAQAYATGMVAGLGMVALGTELYLALEDDWVAMAATVTLALTLLLRSRVFRGFGQRLWLVAAGLAGLVLFALARVAGAGGVAAIIAVMGLMCAAAVAAGMGLWLRHGKPSPFWGRAGDILEILLIITLFPLALGVLDVYSWVRGLAG
ncbi:type VII secretion integral membrane protein EccD [Streptosporangium pseudovulgare]|uniref:Type VII secretion integral membrane protein EccD n=1 Tax=Streptosporangium pseudovulgare TaxID=35765 RepID=A0ABQ2R043_9ACTN|nr:type VII secretion integral membrane protein EccD [Streptosporangium pseudovulgare]GGQ02603.1 type VII secretion integral membrane protein EccD [Streptosporangium pseudovulgare]